MSRNKFVPVKIDSVMKARDIGLSNYTSMMLDSSSFLWLWGNAVTQSLTGNYAGYGTNNQISPILAVADRQYIKLAGNALAALDGSSFAWCWGTNSNGNLGNNRGPDYSASGVPQSVVGGKRWIDLKGNNVVCFGLDSSSYLWGWGNNLSGWVGDNTTTSRSSPVSVVGNRQFIKFSVGGAIFCALDSSSYAWAWGNPAGDNTTNNRSSPTSVYGGIQFVDMFIGFDSAYGLDGSSYLWAWGNQAQYRLNDGTLSYRQTPVLCNGGPWDQIHVCQSQVFGRKNNTYYAWGANTAGEYGNYTTTSFSSPTVIVFPFTIKKMTGAGTSILALDTQSNVWAWGTNSTYGQIGDGTIINKSVPTQPIARLNYSFYTIPNSFIKLLMTSNTNDSMSGGLFLDNSSYAWTWGSGNVTGCLGNNTRTPSISPKSVVGGKQWRNIFIYADDSSIQGGFAVIGLDSSSYAWTWGKNNNGMLGTNSLTDSSSPVSVVGGKQWRKVVTNPNGCCGLDSNSYVWCWGHGSLGSLGNNNNIDSSSPVSVAGGRQAKDIAATYNISAFALIDSAGYIWTWGNNTNGTLGNNTTTDFSSPTSVVINRTFTKITGFTVGTPGFLALDSSSYLWGWGTGTAGNLAENAILSRSSPVSIIGGRQFIDMRYESALDSLSYLWVWGTNSYGALGDNTTANKSSPVSVVGGYQFVDFGKSYGISNYPGSNYLYWGNCSAVVANGTYFSNKGLDFGVSNMSSPVMATILHSYPYMGGYNKKQNILGRSPQ